MNFDVKLQDDIAIVKVNLSRADANNAEDFKNLVKDLIDQKYVKVVIDLSQITFMDSSFLGAMVVNLKRISMSGGQMCLIKCECKDSMVWTLFQTTKMSAVFVMYDTLEEAIDKLGQ